MELVLGVFDFLLSTFFTTTAVLACAKRLTSIEHCVSQCASTYAVDLAMAHMNVKQLEKDLADGFASR
jgi:hypothetical protein